MRYWLLHPDGSGADGPYEPHELRALPGFGPDRVVAPENAQTAEAWTPAHAVSDLHILFVKAPPMPGPASSHGQPRQGSSQPNSPVVPTVAAAPHPTREDAGFPWSDLMKVLAVVGVIAALPVVGWWWTKDNPKGQARKTTPSATRPAADPWQGREQEAIDSVKNFRIRNTMFPRCPRKLEDVCDGASHKMIAPGVRAWPKVTTIPEIFDCKRFYQAHFTLRTILETLVMQGQPRDEAVDDTSRNCRTNPETLRSFEHTIGVVWSAVWASGGRYRVQAVVNNKGWYPAIPGIRATGQIVEGKKIYAWTIDLASKTLQPLDLMSWMDIDYSGVESWGKGYADCNRIQVLTDQGESIDSIKSRGLNCPGVTSDMAAFDVSGMAPSYPLTTSAGPASRSHPTPGDFPKSTGSPIKNPGGLPGMGGPRPAGKPLKQKTSPNTVAPEARAAECRELLTAWLDAEEELVSGGEIVGIRGSGSALDFVRRSGPREEDRLTVVAAKFLDTGCDAILEGERERECRGLDETYATTLLGLGCVSDAADGREDCKSLRRRQDVCDIFFKGDIGDCSIVGVGHRVDTLRMKTTRCCPRTQQIIRSRKRLSASIGRDDAEEAIRQATAQFKNLRCQGWETRGETAP